MSRRRPRQRNRRQRRSNAAVGIPRPSVPNEVRVRMRLGFNVLVPLNTSLVTTQTFNDPTSLLPDWAIRSDPFIAYRIVGLRFTAYPTTAVATAPSATDTRSYASALIESPIGAPSPPTSILSILELPQAQCRPMNTANPLSRRHFSWRCRDLNGLLFFPVAAVSTATNVVMYCGPIGSVAVTSWVLTCTGTIDVEFKGLSTYP